MDPIELSGDGQGFVYTDRYMGTGMGKAIGLSGMLLVSLKQKGAQHIEKGQRKGCRDTMAQKASHMAAQRRHI